MARRVKGGSGGKSLNRPLLRRYPVLLLDPPWAYRDKNAHGERGSSFKYDVLKPKDIAALPMQNVMADDCAVFLWSPAPMLPEALNCLEVWGASYRTVAFNWVKTVKYIEPFSSVVNPWTWLSSIAKFGLGHWTRSSTELCLLGVKGRPPRVEKGVRQVVFYPALKHSAKPPSVSKRIESLMGDVPRLELFAREHAVGWDATGFELDGVDVRDFLVR